MAELKLRNGDYVADGVGGAQRVKGREALLQRVLFKLTARRGGFPFVDGLGSTLYALGSVPAAQRESAAKQAVAEALAEEKDLRIEETVLAGDDLTVRMAYGGESLELHLTVS